MWRRWLPGPTSTDVLRDGGQWTRIGTQLFKPSAKGVEGAAWENLCCKSVEMNKEISTSVIQVEAAVWKIRDARDRSDAHHDQTFAKNTENKEEVLRELWSASKIGHLSPKGPHPHLAKGFFPCVRTRRYS